MGHTVPIAGWFSHEFIIVQWIYDDIYVYSLYMRLYAIMEVSINGGYPNSWMVYNGTSIYKWMICGQPYFRKPGNWVPQV